MPGELIKAQRTVFFPRDGYGKPIDDLYAGAVEMIEAHPDGRLLARSQSKFGVEIDPTMWSVNWYDGLPRKTYRVSLESPNALRGKLELIADSVTKKLRVQKKADDKQRRIADMAKKSAAPKPGTFQKLPRPDYAVPSWRPLNGQQSRE